MDTEVVAAVGIPRSGLVVEDVADTAVGNVAVETVVGTVAFVKCLRLEFRQMSQTCISQIT